MLERLRNIDSSHEGCKISTTSSSEFILFIAMMVIMMAMMMVIMVAMMIVIVMMVMIMILTVVLMSF